MGKRLLVVILFAAALWIPGYLRRELWEPDEARYAYVAKEMRTGGHWFVPHRHGEFYAHKPPMMFWLINASAFLTGGEIGRVATRLPSLLGIILVLWSVGTLTHAWVDRQAAWRAIFITATTFTVWWRAGWGQIDTLLCGLQMMALCLLFLDDRRRSLWRPALAFCCFGLGIVTKGPVGFIIPLGAYVAANLVAGTWRNLRRWHWLWCLPVTLLWPGLWLLAATCSGAPDAYFQELLFDQNVARAAGGLGHIRPFYYYLEHLIVDGLPWIFVLPFSVWALLKHSASITPDPQRNASDAPDLKRVLRRALGWFGFVVVAFSMLPTKRSLYVLLAYPAMAVAVSASWPHLRALPRKALWTAASLLVGVLGVVGVGLFATPWISIVPLTHIPAFCCGGILLTCAVWLMLRFHHEGPSQRWFTQSTVGFIGLYLVIAHIVLPAFNEMKTPRALVPEVQKRVPEGSPLLLYKINAEIMPLYCDRPGKVFWGHVDFWRSGLRQHRRGVAVFLESDWEQEKEDYAWLGETGTFTVGLKRYVWLAYQTNEG
jgi:4-amino-4-deoxy-L-arabinose transferase-like glycosyltransferase